MPQLYEGMYIAQGDGTPVSRLFGLSCGQTRVRGVVEYEACWYGRAKLGFGDLTLLDFKRIAKEIAQGEHFIVLPHCAPKIDVLTRKEINITTPSMEYLAQHALYVITAGEMYRVETSGATPDAAVRYQEYFVAVKRKDVLELITSTVSA